MKPNNLTLRSGPKGRVSKGGNEHLACCPSFETRCALLRMRILIEDVNGPRTRDMLETADRFSLSAAAES